MSKALLASGISLEYDTFGDKNDSPLILIMGLGAQMIAWREEWCELLAAQGFFVVRFDNRDVGLSSHLDDLHSPTMKQFFNVAILNKREIAPYYLKDMAEDVVGLMDFLNIKQAHVCGASMGGMIAQEIAIHFSERLLSMCLIMTSSGDRRLPNPTLKVMMSALTRPSTSKKQKYIAHRARHLQKIGSVNELAPSLESLMEHSARAAKRSPYVRGTMRQSFAVATSPYRTKALNDVETPTLIIHGESDPLVKVEHGKALKEAMPQARLELIKNMGHDIPSPLYEHLSKMITDFAGGNSSRDN